MTYHHVFIIESGPHSAPISRIIMSLIPILYPLPKTVIVGYKADRRIIKTVNRKSKLNYRLFHKETNCQLNLHTLHKNKAVVQGLPFAP